MAQATRKTDAISVAKPNIQTSDFIQQQIPYARSITPFMLNF